VVRSYSGREFNRDTAGAKRAAEDGPVYVTDRGRPSHVLLSIEDYERLLAGRRRPADARERDPAAPPSIVELLGSDPRVADIELPIERSREPLPQVDLAPFLD
jgi:prevent-host-death family protein